MHAIPVCARYGEKADVLAIDLSRRSLAYGKMRAPKFGIENIQFAHADILNIGSDAGLFDIVEAVGVLHHLADPFKGWGSLLKVLRTGGLMAVGLYSAISRQNITALRAATDFPGAGCDDDAARDYRAGLMARQDDGAAWLLKSHDFYSLSNFRDLVLHEHERPVHLSEVANFLHDNGLVFHGFVLPTPIEAEFLNMFPEDTLPGQLSNWEAFEAKHPRTFDGMYQFWCEKR
jgi:SAM-dependent methyltransferase